MKSDKKPSKAELDNHANQLNPNNSAYEKARQSNSTNDNVDDAYADDWEFNHD